MGKLAGKSLNVLMVYQASMSPVHCPFPYSVFTMYWVRKLAFVPSVIRSLVAEGKRRKEFSAEDEEAAAWDHFRESYGLAELDPSEEEAILIKAGLGGGGSFS